MTTPPNNSLNNSLNNRRRLRISIMRNRKCKFQNCKNLKKKRDKGIEKENSFSGNEKVRRKYI